MKIHEVRVFEYCLPLTQPLNLMGTEMRERRGFLLEFRDAPGNCGFGEIAPFPGLHSESLPSAAEQLRQVCSLWPGGKSFRTFDEFSKYVSRNFSENSQLVPSVRFGLEMAYLNLRAAAAKKTVAKILNPDARETISVNGLLTGVSAGIDAEIERLIAETYAAVKMKIGRADIYAELEWLAFVRKKLPKTVSLRLDANRRWSLPEAVAFGKLSGIERIEYIEEPLQNPADLAEFHRQTGLPLALDESLNGADPENFRIPEGTVAFILKPSVLGISGTLQWAEFANKNGISVVISSAFESGLGLAMLANIAAAVNVSDVPAGLDTWRWLARDIISPRFSTNFGLHHISEPVRPDMAILTRKF